MCKPGPCDLIQPRHVELALDGTLIFRGELRQAPGSVAGKQLVWPLQSGGPANGYGPGAATAASASPASPAR